MLKVNRFCLFILWNRQKEAVTLITAVATNSLNPIDPKMFKCNSLFLNDSRSEAVDQLQMSYVWLRNPR